MKTKKIFSTLLIAAFAFSFTTTTNNVSADTTTPTSVPQLNLTVTPNNDGNYNDLKWNMSSASQDYSYKLYSKKSTDAQFQTIPCKGTDTDKVHVLNVYPDVGNNLKSWMEDSNPEDTKGYGKGIIAVDEATISDFNSNPTKWLKDSNGNWKYDVIYLGAWDCDNGENLNDSAVNLIQSFIESGRGILGGHDTIGYTWGNSGLGKLRNLFNIKIGNWNGDYSQADIQSNAGVWGSNITIKRHGLLTNYPWNITQNGDKLNVPISHSTSQFAYGDIWMTYTDGTYTISGTSPNQDLLQHLNFYLTTWNNTAMIQTGHSEGKATSDEQKVLANTLFYLAQVTDQTSWEDHKGQDVDAPNKPVINSVTNDTSKNQISLDYSSTDNGSTYDYYVEATGKNDGTKVTSDTKTATVTTGINGYSIVVDQNPDTIPGNTITTTSTNYVINNSYKNDFYVHIAAIDKAGNISEVTHQKVTVDTAANISLNKTTDNLTVGSTDNLIATITPSDAVDKNVTWTSSDPSIATVDPYGKITAVKPGTVTITASTNNGKTASCNVTVADNTVNLTLFMQDSTTRQYTITKDEFTKFTNWYNLRANGGTLLDSYTFNIPGHDSLPPTQETISFKEIESFEIMSDSIPTADRTNTLTLLMKNSTIREYSLTNDELNKFKHWYSLKANGGTLQSYYIFNVPADDFSPDRKDYVLFNNISSFQVQ
ncbi:Ig-like domain-containing protein [Clostridium felsineum]|uniref:Uncharacterized protein n=1 Tax=Clostridium felsineum TaxID=36839 RepID=A0A1S8KYA3_9CLOT|nr:Ig-like domain-containing protein [Clostridium felsineum]URZ08162.1 hypothetical protein CLROS_035280 [Clostridium felsineum]URZ13193.1 hypothetical protein CROST_039430 [Clostridium felsineum]